MSNAPTGYSRLQIRLHWVVAVLVILQLVFGEGIAPDFDSMLESGVAAYSAASIAHIVAGVAIGLLMLWRLSVRLTRGVPPEGAGITGLAGKAAHWLFYAILIAAPVAGLVAWFGGSETAGDLHTLVKPALIALIALHVAASLWHHFVVKDGVLLRMKNPG